MPDSVNNSQHDDHSIHVEQGDNYGGVMVAVNHGTINNIVVKFPNNIRDPVDLKVFLREELGKLGKLGNVSEVTLNEIVSKCNKYVNEKGEVPFSETVSLQLREKLSRAAHAKNQHLNVESVCEWANRLLLVYPDDFLANFYLYACKDDIDVTMSYINERFDDAKFDDLAEAVRFMTARLENPRHIIPIRSLIEKIIYNFHDKGEQITDEILTPFEAQANKVDEGVYDVTRQRSVFVAYASEDSSEVMKLVEYLEESGQIKCFVALRNLQSGRGALNYGDQLDKAIDNCRIFVLFSTRRSRSSDNVNAEMNHVRKGDFQNAPSIYINAEYRDLPAEHKKYRVEYLPKYDYEKDKEKKSLAVEFFAGQTPRRSYEELRDQILVLLNKQIIEKKETPSIERGGNSDTDSANKNRKKDSDKKGGPSQSAKRKRIAIAFAVPIGILLLAVLLGFIPFLKNTTPAACTADGTEERYGYLAYIFPGLKKTNTITKLGHDWGEFSTPEGACNSTVDSVRKCSRCDETETQTLTLHHAATVDTTRCEYIDSNTHRVYCTNAHCQGWAENHSVEISDSKPATCVDDGLSGIEKCKLCGIVLKQQEVVKALGHTEVEVKAKQPTCTETGLTVGKKCSVCGVVTQAQEVVPLAEHTEIDIEAKQPTCTETGLTVGKKCSVCGIVTKAQEVVPMVEHTIIDIAAKQPTCAEPGLTAGKKCSVCGTVTMAQDTIPTLPHSSGGWIVDIEAQPGKEGSRHRQCYVCGQITLTASIPAFPSSSGLEYTLSSDETYYTVSGIGDCKDTDVVIPVEYLSKPVKEIGYRAFYDCDALTSITIPNSVTEIGNGAFIFCSNLTSIILPNNITSIGSDAFWGCSSLTSITIPDSVTTIGDSAFMSCWNLTSINLPDSITSIGVEAFQFCNSLTSIVIPRSVTYIGAGAFSGCSNLTSITVDKENSVYKDDSNCIIEVATKILVAGCNSSVIPNYVIAIGDSAFYSCDFKSIVIPNGITAIESEAFGLCSNLTSISLPNSITSIEAEAFRYCKSLTSIVIPKNVAYIGAGAFSSCSNLTSITVEKENSVYKDDNNCIIEVATKILVAGCNSSVIPNYVTAIGDKAFYSCDLQSIDIPDGVTTIGSYAFWYCSSLTSITIPDSVTSIGNSAFENCWNLTSITISNGVTTIGKSAFKSCWDLTNITIPDSVTTIGDSAFEYCSSLTSITIPNSVTTIGFWAFWGCSNLTNVTFENTNGWYAKDTPVNVSDPAQAAKYLTDTYCDYGCTWTRKDP